GTRDNTLALSVGARCCIGTKKRSVHRFRRTLLRNDDFQFAAYCVTFVTTVTVLSRLIGSGFDAETVAVSVMLLTVAGAETFTTSLMTKPVSPGRTGLNVGVVHVTILLLTLREDPVVRSL